VRTALPQPCEDDLLTIREAAEKAGTSVWKMKRRLLALHEDYDGVLVSFQGSRRKVRKWWVNPAALLLMKQSRLTIDQLEELREHVMENARKLEGLRDSHVSHKRTTAKMLRKLERKVRFLEESQADAMRGQEHFAKSLDSLRRAVAADCHED
jgi:hypothetical protein